MQMRAPQFDVLRRLLQKAGPYLAIEIVLPGGTLLALLLYLYRHRDPDSIKAGEEIWRKIGTRASLMSYRFIK